MNRRLPISLLLPICLAGCVPPPLPQNGARVMVSNGGSVTTISGTLIALPGHPLKIGFFHDPLNADCSMQGDQHIVLTVLTQPQHGNLADEPNVMDHPEFPGNSLMFKCDTGLVPGTLLTYNSAAGFSGPDYLSYSIYFPNGHELVADTTISVQQP